MASRTTKAKLESRITELNAEISRLSEKITELLQDSENSFLHSHTYQDMQRNLEAAEIASRFDRQHIERLEKENAALKERLTAVAPPSPRSKPGRRSSISAETRAEIKTRADAGQSLRDIAKDMGISKSTIHRILTLY